MGLFSKKKVHVVDNGAPSSQQITTQEEYDLPRKDDARNTILAVPAADGKDAPTEEPIGCFPEKLSRVQKLLEKEQRLIRAILLLVILMNLPFGKYILYPFLIFSTWMHEMCHGMAALIVGGRIDSLYVYEDGSGLAYTSLPDGNGYNLRRAFVASAGFAGTAIVGGILLLFRRTRRGPAIGTAVLGVAMLGSCAIWLVNGFGMIVLVSMGVVLVLCGLILKGRGVGTLYAFLAATACLNSLTSIQGLFEADEYIVGGEEKVSDAETVAKFIGLTDWFWALCWLLLALIMLIIGLVYAIEPSDIEPNANDPELNPEVSGSGYKPMVY